MAVARVGVNAAALTPGTRLDALGSATQAGLPQLTNGPSSELKKEFVASGVLFRQRVQTRLVVVQTVFVVVQTRLLDKHCSM